MLNNEMRNTSLAKISHQTLHKHLRLPDQGNHVLDASVRDSDSL